MNVLQRSLDGGRSFQEASINITERGGTSPFAIDPINTAHLLLGTSRLYESMNSASRWRPIYTFDQTGRERVRALAISPGGSVIYVWVNNGPMVSHDHGASFQQGILDVGRQEPFTSMAVSPRGPDTAYAVGPGQDHPNVYATHDGGASWCAIHHNLPNASANAIVVDARGPQDTLYVGIDGGVFVSTDEGAGWRRYGTGLGVLAVGLNGRSAWRIGTRTPPPR